MDPGDPLDVEQGGPQPGVQAQFAAELSAKLDSLTEAGAGRSPPDFAEDYENPDSMETQGDVLGGPSPGGSPGVGSISDLELTTSPSSLAIPDCDPEHAFTSAILPTFGPLPDPSSDPMFDDSMMMGNLFDDGNQDTGPESGDVTAPDVGPAMCGFRNLGNTCYMNSGLQCVLASPTIVEFFLHFNPDIIKAPHCETGDEKDLAKKVCNKSFDLSKQFSQLLQEVYSGKYSIIQPSSFKETLSRDHSQFEGFRQHDCQEFLALLLDSLHEELVAAGSLARGAAYSMSECTSLELHTPHSTEASCNNDTANVFSFNSLSGKMFDKDSEREAEADLEKEFESVSEVGRADLESVNNIDGTESRGSASPKSYTSYSSVEDKVPANIRMAPIPECIKNDWVSCEQSDSRTSTVSTNSEQETEGSEEGETANIVSNLVTNEQLKKKTVVFSDTVNGVASLGKNNAFSEMNVDIEDFYKEHKTLNVNMNNESQALNNKITFDSEKYRQTENTRPSSTIENLNTMSTVEKCSNAKRFKCTNMETALASETENKRIRLESVEKNVVMETERRESADCRGDQVRLSEAIEADKYWEKYLSKNRSVVAHSFQGQFKNTVNCGACGHVSVSFEPFMYLGLPLPRALDRQIEVVVVLDSPEMPATRHLVTVTQHDRVQNLKEALTAKLDLGGRNIMMREVTKHRITRDLDDNVWLKFVNTSTRTVYCIEVTSIPLPSLQEATERSEDPGCSSLSSSSTSTGTLTESTVTEEPPMIGQESAEWKSCNICLDEMPDSDLISHIECTAVLCRDCLERAEQNSPGKCPVCLMPALPAEWVQLDKSKGVKPTMRMLTINTIFMTQDDTEFTKFGHPRMISLPNIVKYSALMEVAASMARMSVSQELTSRLRLMLVADDGSARSDQDGRHGCDLENLVDDLGELILKPADTLAIIIEDIDSGLMELFNQTRNDESMTEERVKTELELTDCLDSFSSREILDQANPWFCPMCQKNQTASRTLSVWRYPDFLVIHLKRFVYLENGPGGVAGSVKLDKKVNFPLTELDLNPYLSGPLQHGGELFDLYGSVCHYGSSSGGHYTAYVKHCASGDWNFFNDAQVNPSRPEGENQDDAYILFYQRAGLKTYRPTFPNFPAAKTN